MRLKPRLGLGIGMILLVCIAQPGQQPADTEYVALPGDFNGDGKTDLLYVPTRSGLPSEIALADQNGIPQPGFQILQPTQFGIRWTLERVQPVIGDFNGDSLDDVLLQSKLRDASYLLLANINPNAGPIGQLMGINQEIAPQALGIDWSAASHKILAGDFDGDGKDDLLLQATQSSGVHAIVLADRSGGLFTTNSETCWRAGPQHCWADGELGFSWSRSAATLEVGYFNNDGKADLLIQAWPVKSGGNGSSGAKDFLPEGFGTVFSGGMDETGRLSLVANQKWNVDGLGTNWSPLERTLIVADFSGDGRDDVFLQANRSGVPNQLVLADKQGRLQTATTLTNEAVDWTADRVRLIKGRFANSSKAGLLLEWRDDVYRNGIATEIAGGRINVLSVSSLLTGAAAASDSTAGDRTRSGGGQDGDAFSLQPGGGFEALAAVTPPSATTAIGATPAAAEVTQNGAAAYTIPIKLPRGTAGLTPELSLTYNSSSGNGLVGVGWNVTGLGIISRCPRTLAQDGMVLSVQLTTTDEYCLNGNRLRLILGSQGQVNSEYRTELEAYSRIRVLAAVASGPSKWQVERKDGLIEEYGGTADSSIAIQGNSSVYRLWAISKVRDRDLNQYTVTYANEVATKGSYRPEYISYTSNPSLGAGAPYTVQFSYGPRNPGENVVSYYGGGVIIQDKRLTKVEYLYGGSSRRRYDLSYQPTGGSFNVVSRLGSIQECSPSACMAPTTFNWTTQPNSNGLPSTSQTGTVDHGFTNWSMYGYGVATTNADLNNDGAAESIQMSCGPSGCGMMVAMGYQGGQTPPPLQTIPGYTGGTPSGVLDLDADGREDVIFPGNKWLHQNLTGQIVFENLPGTTGGASGFNTIMDVDGDGFGDLVSHATGFSNIRVRFHARDGSATMEATDSVAWTAPAGSTILPTSFPWYMQDQNPGLRTSITQADFNGDGLSDMMIQMSNGWRVLYGNGTGFTTGDLFVTSSTGSGSSIAYETPVPIDLNGDGCTDISYRRTSGSTRTLYYRNSTCRIVSGSTFGPEISTGVTGSNTGGLLQGSSVDLNSDGNQDLLYFGTYLSNGVGFVATGSALGSIWVDRNGDGILDRVNPGTQINQPAGRFDGLGPKANHMISATDGFGKTVAFEYVPLTSTSVYTRGAGTVGKTQDMLSTMYVVRTMTLSDGVGGTYSNTYSYAGAKRNVSGRGFLGFATREWIDSRTGFVTVETYNNNVNNDHTGWELVGTLANRAVYQYKSGAVYGPKVEELAQNWVGYAPNGASNRRYPYVSSATVNRYELSGALISTAVTDTLIDNYGTPYDVRTRTTENGTGNNGGAYHDRTVVKPVGYVLNDVPNWCLSRPQRIEDSRVHTLTHGTSETRISTQVWDASKCRVTSTTEGPGTGQQLVTTLEYDDFGNIDRTIVSGDYIPSGRQPTTDFYFGSNGHLLQSQTVKINGVNRTTTFASDVSLGVRTSQLDPNGLPTTWQYDDFGRERLMTRPDGTRLETLYYVCDSSNSYCGDSLLRYVVRKSEQQVNGTEINHTDQFFDVLGRVKYEQSIGFGKVINTPELIETMRVFDSRGNVLQQSVPYYMSESPIFTTSSYDYLNRPWQVQRPTSDTNGTLLTDTVTYSGLTVTRTDALLKSQTTVSSAWGTVMRATDAYGKHTTYTYSAFGDLRSSTDPAGNLTQIGYNIRGFKTSMTDPDMGYWTYAHDGLGRLVTQTDAKSQTTSFTYDELNRTETREDYPGGAANRTTWEWDTSPYGIGQLHWVTSPGGYAEYHWYDGTGKRIQTVTYPGSGNGSFTMVYSYDSQTRLPLQVTYPASTGSQPVAVQYAYQNGFARTVTDTATGTVYWTALTQDARGHVTRERFGNNQETSLGFDRTNGRLYALQTGPSGGAATQNLAYAWDGVGNLSSRQDLNQGLIESFGYDNLHRLTSSQRNSDSPVTLAYNDIGNITYKGDVGSYTYPTAPGAARPHAVLSAGGLSYAYDANGNMTSRNGASVTWSSYNYPTTINQAGGNTSTFHYGPERQRYRQISFDGSVTEDRITIGGGAFEKLIRGSHIEYRHFVQVAGKAVAVVKRSDQTGNATYYPHEDHLGSTDVITDQSGGIVVRLSFDAWGDRRGSNWTGDPSVGDKAAINSTTHLGYTGHEQLDNLSLVHMNGRVYDPVLARFLSADPIIQDPLHSQAFNRYSYVWNNPLNATDPTGFFSCTGSRIQSSEGGNCPPGSWSSEISDLPQNGQGHGATTNLSQVPKQTGGHNSSQEIAADSSLRELHEEPGQVMNAESATVWATTPGQIGQEMRFAANPAPTQEQALRIYLTEKARIMQEFKLEEGDEDHERRFSFTGLYAHDGHDKKNRRLPGYERTEFAAVADVSLRKVQASAARYGDAEYVPSLLGGQTNGSGTRSIIFMSAAHAGEIQGIGLVTANQMMRYVLLHELAHHKRRLGGIDADGSDAGEAAAAAFARKHFGGRQ